MSAAMRCRVAVFLLGVAAPAMAAVAAHAEPNPFASPQHDADITYAIPTDAIPGAAATDHDGQPRVAGLTQRLRVQAATGLQRIDPPSAGAYMVTDGHTGRMLVIQPQRRSATLVPSQGGRLPPLGERATGTYQRLGLRTVAGAACTDWRTRDETGQDSVVCLTDDGMLLQVVQDGRIRAQAVRLDRSPQPDTLFAIPAGFSLIQAAPQVAPKAAN